MSSDLKTIFGYPAKKASAFSPATLPGDRLEMVEQKDKRRQGVGYCQRGGTGHHTNLLGMLRQGQEGVSLPFLKLQSSRALLGLAPGWLPSVPADVAAGKQESCKRRA